MKKRPVKKYPVKKISTLCVFLFFASLSLTPIALAAEPAFGFDDDEEEQEVKIERVTPDPMAQMLSALVAELPANQVVNLPLAEEETFLALQINALSAKAKGQVLLLPGDRQHPNWPQGIAPLREVLPEYGWTTLSIALPIYKGTSVAERTLPPGALLPYSSLKKAADNPVEETKSNANAVFLDNDMEEDEAVVEKEVLDPSIALNAQRTLIESRLNAALQHLGNKGQQVLILQGESVYWLQNWLAEGNLPKRSPLILLYVEAPTGADSAGFTELITMLGNRPILDIYAGQNVLQTHLAAERKLAYLRAGNNLASQMVVKVPVSSGDGTDSRWLTQRVEGWLRSL